MSERAAVVLIFGTVLAILISLIILYIIDVRRDRQLADLERRKEIDDFNQD